MTIGQFIKETRLKKGITQEELATKTSLSVRTIQRIENGEVDPRVYTLKIIAKAIEVEYDEIINIEKGDMFNGNYKIENTWLPILHLCGLFVLLVPQIILLLWGRNKVKGIKKHAIDIINYQLSLSLYIIISAILLVFTIGFFLIVLLIIFNAFVSIINTIRVINNQPYKYPLSIQLINP